MTRYVSFITWWLWRRWRYDWRADAIASYAYAIHRMRLDHVAAHKDDWRNCVEMYAWEGGR